MLSDEIIFVGKVFWESDSVEQVSALLTDQLDRVSVKQLSIINSVKS